MVSVSIEIYSIVEDWFELDHCRLDDWLDAGGDEEEYMRIRDEIVQDMADEAEGDIVAFGKDVVLGRAVPIAQVQLGAMPLEAVVAFGVAGIGAGDIVEALDAVP